jgi:hypothetical protein
MKERERYAEMSTEAKQIKCMEDKETRAKGSTMQGTRYYDLHIHHIPYMTYYFDIAVSLETPTFGTRHSIVTPVMTRGSVKSSGQYGSCLFNYIAFSI